MGEKLITLAVLDDPRQMADFCAVWRAYRRDGYVLRGVVETDSDGALVVRAYREV